MKLAHTAWPSHGLLQTVTIEGLFGARYEKVVLNTNLPTVLTGPNGSGKSTVLKLIYAAGKLQLVDLLTIRFDRLELLFKAGDKFTVVKDRKTKAARITWREHLHVQKFDEGIASLSAEVRRVLADPDVSAERAIERMQERGSFSARTYEDFRYNRSLLAQLDPNVLIVNDPEWFISFTKYFGVEFISDRRLVESMEPAERTVSRSRSENPDRAVTAAARRIGSLLTDAQAGYGRSTERMDQRLPERVVEAARSGTVPRRNEVLGLAEEVKTKTQQLRDVGLLEARQEGHESIVSPEDDQPEVLKIVATILRSTLERLEQLDAEAERLGAFKSFLDRRLLGKTLVLGGRRGMVFELSSGHVIRPDQLSSGEQHLVILAYDLIFATRERSLVIIDEPEISLHVAWQDHLLNDFIQLGAPRQLRFLMASHAPSLIAEHPECQFPIGVFS